MGISSVNIGLNNSYGAYTQRLSEATKKKLEELGIPYNDKTTESEGRSLIQNYISTHKNDEESSLNNQETQDSSFNPNQEQQNDLFKRAQKLAEKLGIEVNENDKIDVILSKIETQINEKLTENENNIDMLKELQGYSRELSFLQAEASGDSSGSYEDSNQALMKSLEILGQYNKNFLKK